MRTIGLTILALLFLSAPVAGQEQTLNAAPKDPGTATLISVFITGGGHMYTGETGKGIALLGAGILAPLAGVVATVLTCEEDPYGNVDDCNFTPLLLGAGVSVAAKIYSLVDSGPSAHRMNARHGIIRRAALDAEPLLSVSREGDTRIGVRIRR